MNNSSSNSIGADAATALAGPSFALPSESDRATVAVGGPIEPLAQRLSHLSPRQQTALRALMAGLSLGAVAEQAGVDTSTLFRWRTRDKRFMAALDGWRDQVEQSTRDRILAAGDQAIDTVLTACRKGDVRTSLTVLKSLCAPAPRPSQPRLSFAFGGRPAAAPAAAGAERAPAASAQTPADDPRKADLETLERLLDGMNLDPRTRSACLAPLVRHRAAVESPAPAPHAEPPANDAVASTAPLSAPAAELCGITIEKIGQNRSLVIAKLAEFLDAPKPSVEKWLSRLPLKIGRRFSPESAAAMAAILQEIGATVIVQRIPA